MDRLPESADDHCDWLAPILLVGSPRSGTTRLTRALTAHPRLAITNEANILPFLRTTQVAAGLGMNECLEEGPMRLYGCVSAALRDRFTRLYERHARSLIREVYREEFADKSFTRFGDKLVFGAHMVSDLRAAFPRAQFVHLVRDPQTCILSIAQFQRRQAAVGEHVDVQDFETLCRGWVAQQLQLTQALGPRCSIRVCYEDMVDDPDTVWCRVLDFLGVPTDHRAASVFRDRPAGGHATSSSEAASLERWRELTAEQSELVASICGPMMERLGYVIRS